MSTRFFSGMMLTLLLFSCSPKVAYHNGIKDRYSLTDGEIGKIQFYVSDDIILYKSESESGHKTDKGELVVSNKTDENRIIIKKGTPGVVIKIEDAHTLLVSFETDDKTLKFASQTDNGSYTLQVEEWINGRGKITYGKDTYYAASGSGNVYLIFKIRKLDKKKSTDKVVGGRKVND